MATSILLDIKKTLGLAEDYTPFDHDLILQINAVLADLNQLGIGPEEGLAIEGETETWDDLHMIDARYNHVKSYVYLRVKMLFDPPTVGYVITAMEKMIEKAEWRINVAREDIVYPEPVEAEVTEDPFEEGLLLDGGIW